MKQDEHRPDIARRRHERESLMHAAGRAVARAVTGNRTNLPRLEDGFSRAGSAGILQLNKGLITFGWFASSGSPSILRPGRIIRVDHIQVPVHDGDTVGQPVGELPQSLQASGKDGVSERRKGEGRCWCVRSGHLITPHLRMNQVGPFFTIRPLYVLRPGGRRQPSPVEGNRPKRPSRAVLQ